MLPTRRTRTPAWDPFESIHRDFDRMLGRYFSNGDEPTPTAAYPVDIHEDDNHLYVEAELPGFNREDVNVTLENGMLTITAERQEEKREGETHLNERRFRRVHRSFTLPNTVDEGNVDATLSDGVLKLTLNKKEEVKPRRIEVK